MQRRAPIVVLIPALTLALAAAGLGQSAQARPGPDPHPTAKRTVAKGWDEADKSGFGTARGRDSKVWFTMEGGRVSDVYYPDLSTPSIRNLELSVSDGSGWDRQSTDMTSVVSRPDERSLRFTE